MSARASCAKPSWYAASSWTKLQPIWLPSPRRRIQVSGRAAANFLGGRIRPILKRNGSMSLTLMDSSLQRIDQARHWMDEDDSFERHNLLTGAVQIVGELRSTLNVRDGCPFAANLDDLCEYMS